MKTFITLIIATALFAFNAQAQTKLKPGGYTGKVVTNVEALGKNPDASKVNPIPFTLNGSWVEVMVDVYQDEVFIKRTTASVPMAQLPSLIKEGRMFTGCFISLSMYAYPVAQNSSGKQLYLKSDGIPMQ